jgi:hypothetical protein
MRESGKALVQSLGVKGLEVLDLGCGDGTTDSPAAKDTTSIPATFLRVAVAA